MAKSESVSWKDQPWKCNNCDLMLGVLSKDGITLRIKWRDLYIEIEDAKRVTETCRRCGKTNSLVSDDVLLKGVSVESTVAESPFPIIPA